MRERGTVQEYSGEGFVLTGERIEEYIAKLSGGAYSPVTLECYRRQLEQLYRLLPEDKRIREGTLQEMGASFLEKGYAAATVNALLAAVNGLLLYYGRRELQADRLAAEQKGQPELNRAEYLRLLSAGRMQGRKREYLLVKVFGTLGLAVGDLPGLTAEAVKQGALELPGETVVLPEGLQKELELFLKEEGIRTGPVFRTREGKALNRTAVSRMMQTLCQDARVAEEKATPRCLKKLCQDTRAEILEGMKTLMEQEYDRLLRAEQRAIGWEN